MYSVLPAKARFQNLTKTYAIPILNGLLGCNHPFVLYYLHSN